MKTLLLKEKLSQLILYGRCLILYKPGFPISGLLKAMCAHL